MLGPVPFLLVFFGALVLFFFCAYVDVMGYASRCGRFEQCVYTPACRSRARRCLEIILDLACPCRKSTSKNKTMFNELTDHKRWLHYSFAFRVRDPVRAAVARLVSEQKISVHDVDSFWYPRGEGEDAASCIETGEELVQLVSNIDEGPATGAEREQFANDITVVDEDLPARIQGDELTKLVDDAVTTNAWNELKSAAEEEISIVEVLNVATLCGKNFHVPIAIKFAEVTAPMLFVIFILMNKSSRNEEIGESLTKLGSYLVTLLLVHRSTVCLKARQLEPSYDKIKEKKGKTRLTNIATRAEEYVRHLKNK